MLYLLSISILNMPRPNRCMKLIPVPPSCSARTGMNPACDSNPPIEFGVVPQRSLALSSVVICLRIFLVFIA